MGIFFAASTEIWSRQARINVDFFEVAFIQLCFRWIASIFSPNLKVICVPMYNNRMIESLKIIGECERQTAILWHAAWFSCRVCLCSSAKCWPIIVKSIYLRVVNWIVLAPHATPYQYPLTIKINGEIMVELLTERVYDVGDWWFDFCVQLAFSTAKCPKKWAANRFVWVKCTYHCY